MSSVKDRIAALNANKSPTNAPSPSAAPGVKRGSVSDRLKKWDNPGSASASPSVNVGRPSPGTMPVWSPSKPTPAPVAPAPVAPVPAPATPQFDLPVPTPVPAPAPTSPSPTPNQKPPIGSPSSTLPTPPKPNPVTSPVISSPTPAHSVPMSPAAAAVAGTVEDTTTTPSGSVSLVIPAANSSLASSPAGSEPNPASISPSVPGPMTNGPFRSARSTSVDAHSPGGVQSTVGSLKARLNIPMPMPGMLPPGAGRPSSMPLMGRSAGPAEDLVHLTMDRPTRSSKKRTVTKSSLLTQTQSDSDCMLADTSTSTSTSVVDVTDSEAV